jgi:protein tyrosine/serine phosphatase
MKPLKTFFKILITLLFSLLVAVLWWLGYLRYGGNFHKVAEGVYRSAQLYDFDMPELYNKYRFRTILNLRGAKPGKEWYEYEKRFAKEHDITLVDFKISDKKVQSLEVMKRLINIVKKAEKPVLIHCRAGADRTGLVSALYLYSVGDKNASEMLSVKYGHFPYLGSKTKAMDESFKKFVSQSSR